MSNIVVSSKHHRSSRPATTIDVSSKSPTILPGRTALAITGRNKQVLLHADDVRRHCPKSDNANGTTMRRGVPRRVVRLVRRRDNDRDKDEQSSDDVVAIRLAQKTAPLRKKRTTDKRNSGGTSDEKKDTSSHDQTDNIDKDSILYYAMTYCKEMGGKSDDSSSNTTTVPWVQQNQQLPISDLIDSIRARLNALNINPKDMTCAIVEVMVYHAWLYRVSQQSPRIWASVVLTHILSDQFPDDEERDELVRILTQRIIDMSPDVTDYHTVVMRERQRHNCDIFNEPTRVASFDHLYGILSARMAMAMLNKNEQCALWNELVQLLQESDITDRHIMRVFAWVDRVTQSIGIRYIMADPALYYTIQYATFPLFNPLLAPSVEQRNQIVAFLINQCRNPNETNMMTTGTRYNSGVLSPSYGASSSTSPCAMIPIVVPPRAQHLLCASSPAVYMDRRYPMVQLQQASSPSIVTTPRIISSSPITQQNGNYNPVNRIRSILSSSPTTENCIIDSDTLCTIIQVIFYHAWRRRRRREDVRTQAATALLQLLSQHCPGPVAQRLVSDLMNWIQTTDIDYYHAELLNGLYEGGCRAPRGPILRDQRGTALVFNMLYNTVLSNMPGASSTAEICRLWTEFMQMLDDYFPEDEVTDRRVSLWVDSMARAIQVDVQSDPATYYAIQYGAFSLLNTSSSVRPRGSVIDGIRAIINRFCCNPSSDIDITPSYRLRTSPTSSGGRNRGNRLKDMPYPIPKDCDAVTLRLY